MVSGTIQFEAQKDLEARGLDWPDLYFDPINLWNVPHMDAKEVVKIAKHMEETTPCQKKCKLDVWGEKCVTCKRTIQQIKEAYERTIN